MKVKIRESELDNIFYELLFEQDPKNVLNEELSGSDKDDVRKIVKQEVSKFLNMSRNKDFDKKVEELVVDTIKNERDVEKYFVEIVKNVITQLYKAFWVKRHTWRSALDNKAS